MEGRPPQHTHLGMNERGRRSTSRNVKSTNGADRSPRPRGREAVMTAVLDAAMALFAAHGPASVSVRDIAAAARVNHALVHRHFGSKQEVLRAVLDRAVTESAASMNEIVDNRSSLKQGFK